MLLHSFKDNDKPRLVNVPLDKVKVDEVTYTDEIRATQGVLFYGDSRTPVYIVSIGFGEIFYRQDYTRTMEMSFADDLIIIIYI